MTLAIPSPHLDASPLGVFPPPAPRRSLRDRCGVDLTLQIDPPRAQNPSKLPTRAGPWPPKGHVQPHRSHLPRRRNPQPRFTHLHDGAEKLAGPASAVPLPAATPAPAQTHLQAVIPAVWVAFAGRGAEHGFTHVVEICRHDAGGSVERRSDGPVQRLRLLLPGPPPPHTCTTEGRAALALEDGQLRAARDFMAECLPPARAALPDQTDVRVLVTTPPGRPTDAMCVLACYLAYVAGRDVDAILRYIDEEESLLSVWKGEVCGDEIDRIEKIARGSP